MFAPGLRKNSAPEAVPDPRMDATKAARGSEVTQSGGNGYDSIGAAVTSPPQTPSSTVTISSARDEVLTLERKLPPEVSPDSSGPEARSPSAMSTAATHGDQHPCTDSSISSTVAVPSRNEELKAVESEMITAAAPAVSVSVATPSPVAPIANARENEHPSNASVSPTTPSPGEGLAGVELTGADQSSHGFSGGKAPQGQFSISRENSSAAAGHGTFVATAPEMDDRAVNGKKIQPAEAQKKELPVHGAAADVVAVAGVAGAGSPRPEVHVGSTPQLMRDAKSVNPRTDPAASADQQPCRSITPNERAAPQGEEEESTKNENVASKHSQEDHSEFGKETEVESVQDNAPKLDFEDRGEKDANSKSKLPFSDPNVADTSAAGRRGRDESLEARDVTAKHGSTIDANLPKTSGGNSEKMPQPIAPGMAMTHPTVGGSVQTSAATPGGDVQSSFRQLGAMSAGAAAAAHHASRLGDTSLRVAAPASMHAPETPGAAGIRPPSAYFLGQTAAYYHQMKQQGAGQMLGAVAAANDASVLSAVMAMRTNVATHPSVAAPGPTVAQAHRVAGDPQRPYPSGVVVPTYGPALPGLPAGVLAFQRGHAGSALPLPPASVAPLPALSHGGFTHALFQHTVRGASVGTGVPSAINVAPAVTPVVMSAASASAAPVQEGKIAAQPGLPDEVVATADPLISEKSSAETSQVDEMSARSPPVGEPSIERKGKTNGSSSAGESGAETAVVDASVAIASTPGVIESTQMSTTGTSTVSTPDIPSTPDPSAASTPAADAPAVGRSVGEDGAQGGESSTADADTPAVLNATGLVATGPNTSFPAPRAQRTPKRATAASPSGAPAVKSASNRRTSASSRSGSGAAISALPRRFSSRLANEQQSQDEIMQGLCMICLEKLSDPAEGSSAKLLGLLDSCAHKYCHAVRQHSKYLNFRSFQRLKNCNCCVLVTVWQVH